jgi:hypothetical protein
MFATRSQQQEADDYARRGHFTLTGNWQACETSTPLCTTIEQCDALYPRIDDADDEYIVLRYQNEIAVTQAVPVAVIEERPDWPWDFDTLLGRRDVSLRTIRSVVDYIETTHGIPEDAIAMVVNYDQCISYSFDLSGFDPHNYDQRWLLEYVSMNSSLTWEVYDHLETARKNTTTPGLRSEEDWSYDNLCSSMVLTEAALDYFALSFSWNRRWLGVNASITIAFIVALEAAVTQGRAQAHDDWPFFNHQYLPDLSLRFADIEQYPTIPWTDNEPWPLAELVHTHDRDGLDGWFRRHADRYLDLIRNEGPSGCIGWMLTTALPITTLYRYDEGQWTYGELLNNPGVGIDDFCRLCHNDTIKAFLGLRLRGLFSVVRTDRWSDIDLLL